MGSYQVNTQLKIIESINDFENIREEWNMLYDESEKATIFSSWDWMFTWWEVFNKAINSKLFILVIYQNEKLIGIAPFHISHSFPKSLIQGRTISFIGCGEETPDKIVSQYADFIVRPEHESLMISSVSRYLNETKSQWDFADFLFLLDSSIISKCFKFEETKIHTDLNQYGNRFYIPHMKSFDDFQNQMGNRWSKMFTKKNKKLENDGEVKIESSNDIDTAKKAFKQLTEMHEARWNNLTDINIFKSTLFNEFHAKILERLVPQNKASINTLVINNEPLASYYYQSGFHTMHANRYSPLFLLVCKEIDLAINNNFYLISCLMKTLILIKKNNMQLNASRCTA
ncbi:MAG: CelD/BcsL family acetyltransferase involved in cellulose biosynthesis [Cocleimonas sp.]|jgi:CelD/BcsL family acetyltransferase involved in cellulose biosynthesis